MRNAIALLALLVCSTLRADDAKEPEIGMDYRKLFKEEAKLIADGKAQEAVELIVKHAQPGVLNDALRETLAKRFAIVFGAGGKYIGYEVVGYKRLSSRLYRFYAIVYFEKTAVVFNLLFIKTIDAGWKIQQIEITDKVDVLDAVAQFVPLSRVND